MSNINVDNITPLAGTTGTLSVSGSLHVSGSVTANGNIILGNEVGDSVSLGAEVSSSIIPDANNTYDLGSNAKTWKTMHQSTASIGVVSGSVIPDSTNTYDLGASTSQWKDLYIDGIAYIDEIGENVSSSGNITALNFIATGSEGNITASGNVLINGEFSTTTDVLQLGINVSGSLTSTGSFGHAVATTLGGTLLTAAQTNITSVGSLTSITSTGNSILGNAAADTHTFTGDITASGNISASGTVFADNFQSTGGDDQISFNDNINLTGNLTASGDISSSGTLDVTGNVNFDGDLDVDGTTNLDIVDIDGAVDIATTLTVAGNITSSLTSTGSFGNVITTTLGGTLLTAAQTNITSVGSLTSITSTGNSILGNAAADTHTFTGDITASGGISASGTIIGNKIETDTLFSRAGDANTGLQFSSDTVKIEGNDGIIAVFNQSKIELNSPITASGDISASGTVTANAFVGNITGDLTGEADTVATIAGLAPNTATTQATQASITTAANLTTVGALDAGSITSGFTSIDVGAGAITTTGAVSTGAINATGAVSASTTLTGLNLIVTGSGATQGNITATGTGSFAHIIGTKIVGALTGDVVGDVTGDLTGEADTVATIAGLAPNTATTQATQGAITSLGTLTGLNVDGNITASGDISSSGTVTGLSGSLQHLFVSGSVIVRSEGSVNPGDAALKIIGGGGANDDATLSLRQNLGTAGYGIRYDGGVDHFQILGNNETRIDFEIKNSNGLVSIAGDISGSGDLLVGKQLNVLGSITASGNISSSGDVYADDYLVNNVSSLDNNGTQLRLGYNTTYTKISLGRALATTQVAIEGNITASGAISASGTLIANRYVSKTETVAAAGSDISDAALLPKSSGIIFVTTDDAAKGVKLPAVSTVAIGSTYTIHNTAASTALEIYPTANDKIFPLADDAPATVAANTAMVVTAFSADGYVGYFTTVIS